MKKLTYVLLIILGLLVISCGTQPTEAPAESGSETETTVEATAEETPEEVEATATTAPVEETTEETTEEATTDESETDTGSTDAGSEGATGEMPPGFSADDVHTTDSGLQCIIEEEGDGPKPEPGDIVQVHYKGLFADGSTFDSSYDRDEPFAFPLGEGQVIPGWDEGVALLNVGGKAKLIIPPELAYGERGAGGVIPPNATIFFEVELLDILEGAPESPTEVDEADYEETDSGLKYYDFEVGEGESPTAGQLISVHYTGWLEDGTKFDSSLDRGQAFTFPIGTGQVIPGWDEGVLSMNVGGKRQLVIPGDLAYGEAGAGGVIPPNATLIFEVELLSIEEQP